MAAGLVVGGFHRLLESAAVVVAAVLTVVVALALAPSLDGMAAGFGCVAAAAFGYAAADFVSGLLHWIFDRFFHEDTPYLGPNFVRPFREHHRDPDAIVAHDFVELNGNTCIAAIPVLAATAWALPAEAGLGAICAASFVLSLVLWTLATNQIHRWAHAPLSPSPVRALQRAGLVLAPAHHAVHHRAPFDRCYCITSGLLNPWLDRVGLFRALEAHVGPPRRGRRALRG